MKRHQLNRAVDQILLTVFERESREPNEYWTLRSAFRVSNRDDYEEIGAGVLGVLLNRGWATSDEDTTMALKELPGGGLEFGQRKEPAVQLTERGRDRVYSILRQREPRTMRELIAEAQWPMWGGIAAIIAALASVAAAVLSYLALGA